MGQPPSSYFLLRRALAPAPAEGRADRGCPGPLARRRASRRRSGSGPSCSRRGRRSTWPGPPATPTSSRGGLARLLPTFPPRRRSAPWSDALRGAARRGFESAKYRGTRGRTAALGIDVHPWVSPTTRPTPHHSVEGFGVDPVYAAYLDRFLALAASRNIPAFWVLPPTRDDRAQRYAERSGFDARHLAFVAPYQGRHPALTVLDGRQCGYGPGLYNIDPIHMNCDGRLGVQRAGGVGRVAGRSPECASRSGSCFPALPRTGAGREVESLCASASAIMGGGTVRR